MNPIEGELYGVEIPQEPTEKKAEEVKPRFQWGGFAKAMFFPTLNLVCVIALVVMHQITSAELKRVKIEAVEKGYGKFTTPDSFEWVDK